MKIDTLIVLIDEEKKWKKYKVFRGFVYLCLY